MSETKTHSRSELMTMAKAYHGKAYTDAQFEQFSDARLLSMSHPWDSQRKGKGWQAMTTNISNVLQAEFELTSFEALELLESFTEEVQTASALEYDSHEVAFMLYTGDFEQLN